MPGAIIPLNRWDLRCSSLSRWCPRGRLAQVPGDISPRVAGALDLFGDGKTAIKINLGRYLDPASNNANYTGPDPTARLITAVTRSWTDANSNFIPECDLVNPLGQDNRETGGDSCGQIFESEFREERVQQYLQPGDSLRLGCPPLQLGLRVHPFQPNKSFRTTYWVEVIVLRALVPRATSP